MAGEVPLRPPNSGRPSEPLDTTHRRPHILLALTGSVASLKAPLLFQELSRHGLVKVVCTEPSKHFFDIQALKQLVNLANGHVLPSPEQPVNDSQERQRSMFGQAAPQLQPSPSQLSPSSAPQPELNFVHQAPNRNSQQQLDADEWLALIHQSVFDDADEWRLWRRKGDPVLHIQLRQWADLLVVAPLDANTLAKLAYGLCDNLVTCVARAWDLGRPWLVAPAMNDRMWEHPFTGAQLEVLERQLNVSVVRPVRKLLACNVEGMGAMAAPETIAQAVGKALEDRCHKNYPRQPCVAENASKGLVQKEEA